jgi:hypothetical protein
MMSFIIVIILYLNLIIKNKKKCSKALFLNKAALISAILITLKGMAFGPRPGPNLKYVNHGYDQITPPMPSYPYPYPYSVPASMPLSQ